MPGPERYKNRIELLQGTLDLIILHTLKWGAQHGYGITQTIATGSGERFQVDTGSLYPALHRLEKRRLVKSEWRVSDNKQRAKYYELTAAGRKELASEQSRWAQVVAAMEALTKAPASEVS